MSSPAAGWMPDPFATRFERRADGAVILSPLGAMAPCPARFIDHLEHWARAAPDRVLVARRDASGAWCEVRYAQMLRRVVQFQLLRQSARVEHSAPGRIPPA